MSEMIKHIGQDFLSYVENISRNYSPESSLKETMMVNLLTGKIESLKKMEANDNLKFIDCRNPIYRKHKYKYNLLKFKFEKIEIYDEVFDFEISYNDKIYLPISVVGFATRKFGIPYIQNIWQIQFSDMDKKVKVQENLSEDEVGESSGIPIVDFLVQKFVSEKIDATNSINLIKTNDFKKLFQGE